MVIDLLICLILNFYFGVIDLVLWVSKVFHINKSQILSSFLVLISLKLLKREKEKMNNLRR